MTLLSAVLPINSCSLSPATGSAPLVGKPTRTKVLVLASRMLMVPSASLLLPSSITLGAAEAWVSKVQLSGALKPLWLPAPSCRRALSALTPSLPSKAVLMLKST